MGTCRAIRQQENDHEQLPVVMVAAQEDQTAGAVAGVTDWLIKPFNDAYARTKIRAWTLRAACRWMTGILEDKERRLPRPPMHVRRAAMAQKGTGRFSENVIRTDKSALLWMYCREIAPFETPTFSTKVGELIARATKRSSEMRNRSAAN
jgi:DNA-binding response OmpR family regulator